MGIQKITSQLVAIAHLYNQIYHMKPCYVWFIRREILAIYGRYLRNIAKPLKSRMFQYFWRTTFHKHQIQNPQFGELYIFHVQRVQTLLPRHLQILSVVVTLTSVKRKLYNECHSYGYAIVTHNGIHNFLKRIIEYWKIFMALNNDVHIMCLLVGHWTDWHFHSGKWFNWYPLFLIFKW